MDGPHSYHDEPDGRWYQDYPDRYPGTGGYDDERYRTPEPRHGAPGDPGGDQGRFRDWLERPEAEAIRSRRIDPGLVPGNSSGPPAQAPVQPLSPAAAPTGFGEPLSSFGEPLSSFGEPLSSFGEPQSSFGEPLSSHAEPAGATVPYSEPGGRHPDAFISAPTQLAPATPAPGQPAHTRPDLPPGAVPGGGGPARPLNPGGGPGPAPLPGLMSGQGDASGAIYRTRRGGLAALLVAVAIVVESLSVRMLLGGEFGHPYRPGDVLAAIFVMAGTPLGAMGLYGLLTGAAGAAVPQPGRAWLRPPLALLPIGLVLVLAGALAV